MTESRADAIGGPLPVKLELSRKESVRFWAKVERRGPNDCWLWKAGANDKGYGNFKIGRSTLKAHRVSFEIHVHKLPAGQCALHSCDTPRCVNPAHLFAGTQADNMADMTNKGRRVPNFNMDLPVMPGVENPSHKLSEDDVLEIRRRYAAGGVSQRALAGEFGVCQRTVTVIVNGHAWRHLA